MKKIYSEWTKKVKIAMIEKDMDISDLAIKFKWTVQYTSALINGRIYYREPVERISRYLEIDVPMENQTLSKPVKEDKRNEYCKEVECI